MARRKKKQHAHVDERWLLTYADVITLLFALFIVLFSISVVNQSKFEALKATLAGAFDVGILDGGSAILPETKADTPAPVTESSSQAINLSSPLSAMSPASPNQTVSQALETSQLQRVKQMVDKEVAEAGFKGRVTATVNERGLAIRILTDGVLFDSGSYVLRPEGLRLLKPIGTSLVGLSNTVRIEGHTDTDPIHTSAIPNNRWLSSARANMVADYMNSLGLSEARMETFGGGSTHPVASNDTAANKQKNRRVEMLVLREQGAPGSQAPPLGG